MKAPEDATSHPGKGHSPASAAGRLLAECRARSSADSACSNTRCAFSALRALRLAFLTAALRLAFEAPFFFLIFLALRRALSALCRAALALSLIHI